METAVSEPETKTLARLCEERGLTSSATEGGPYNPTFGDHTDVWTVRLRYQKRSLTVPFYMGVAHQGRTPTTVEVLDCLLSDASGYENARSFDDWCSEYGYNTDSRKTEKLYRDVERIAEKLTRFLGDDYALFANAERE